MTVTSGTFTETSPWSIWVTDDGVQVRRHNQNEIQEIRRLDAEESRAAQERSYREQEEAKKKKEEAEQKAKEMLLDLIGEEELRIYEDTGRILVHGREYDYLLERKGRVQRLEKDKLIDLCIHINNRWKYPETDNVVSLKLLAEADEKKFNELANVKRTYDRPEKLPECACAAG